MTVSHSSLMAAVCIVVFVEFNEFQSAVVSCKHNLFFVFFSYCLILFHTQQTSMAIHCDFMRVRRRRRNVLYAFFGDCLSPE